MVNLWLICGNLSLPSIAKHTDLAGSFFLCLFFRCSTTPLLTDSGDTERLNHHNFFPTGPEPLWDRQASHLMPKNQANFIRIFITPFHRIVSELFPTMTYIKNVAERNFLYWSLFDSPDAAQGDHNKNQASPNNAMQRSTMLQESRDKLNSNDLDESVQFDWRRSGNNNTNTGSGNSNHTTGGRLLTHSNTSDGDERSSEMGATHKQRTHQDGDGQQQIPAILHSTSEHSRNKSASMKTINQKKARRSSVTHAKSSSMLVGLKKKNSKEWH